VSKETDRVMGHADEADGIEEYDNPLPDWWIGLFWLTIVWALGYTLHYHFIADRSQVGALEREMAAADVRWPEQARAAFAFNFSLEAASQGQQVYDQNCFPCHGTDLEGGIGPSFVDAEWIHGGSASDIVRIIREGVAAKGMVAWEGILSPEQINAVASYVIQRHAEATGRSIEEITTGPANDASTGM
jgi:cytochrome c oxidase cbb3-type subunit 3